MAIYSYFKSFLSTARSRLIAERWVGITAAFAISIFLLILAVGFGINEINSGRIGQFQTQESTTSTTPEQVLGQMALSPHRDLLATKGSKNFFWILIDLNASDARGRSIELDSRHLVEATCFDAVEFVQLGKMDRSSQSGRLKLFRSGVLLESVSNLDRLLCKLRFQGPARLEVRLWEAFDTRQANARFHANANLLDGAALSLAIFSIVVAAFSGLSTYLIFGAWLVVNFRVAALSLGTDYWLFGEALDFSLIVWSRKFCLAGNSFLSMLLLVSMFKRELSILKLGAIAKCMIISATVLLLISFFIGYEQFLPLLWIQIGVCCLATFGVLTLVNLRQPSLTSALYSIGWGISAASVLAEVLGAVLGIRSLPWYLNSVAGAIGSSFLIATALGAKLREDRLTVTRSESKAVEALTKYQENYDKVPVGLFTLLPTGVIPQHNPAFAAMFGVLPNTSPTWDALIPDFPLSLLQPESDTHTEFSIKSAGQTRWFEVQTLRQNDIIEGTIAEITERKLGEQQLQYAAHFDQLTALHNRHFMIQHLDQMLTATDSPNTHIGALVMVDIERFHQVVTYFGHATGDNVLCAVRDRIRDKIPAETLLGRLSADTFVLIFDGATLSVARQITQRILDTIHGSPFATSDKSFNLRARAGVVELDTSMSSKDALTACDAAMQDAKVRGGGCLVAYADQDPAWLNHKAESDLMAQFSVHIPFERMEMFYQPIISLNNPEKSMGYEALIRLHGEDGRLVSPAHFIPALEKSGMMSQLDRWVVRDVFAFLERYPKHFEKLTYCSVNLSGASLNDERFLDEMLSLAAQHPHTVQKICFEITETVALADVQSTKRFVQSIKSLGARIALDDFGAGYSSFGYLSELNADFIKIDGKLVNGLMQGSTNFAVVKAISDLGRSLNMHVVAEWVENAEVLQILLSLGVTAGQGWALSKPMRADDIAQHSNGGSFIKDEAIRKVLKLETKAALIKTKPVTSASTAV